MEGVGEEFWDERDCEAPHDQGADRELVAGDGHEVGLESGGAARSDDHAVGERGGPVFIAEVGEAYGGLGCERVVWRERDHETLSQEVMHARRVGSDAGVFVDNREIELAGADLGGELFGGSLVERDLDVGVGPAQPLDCGGHEAGECGRERSDPEPCAPPGAGGRYLDARELEASSDRVGMLEQGLSLGGQPDPARASLEQPRTELAFELGDLG